MKEITCTKTFNTDTQLYTAVIKFDGNTYTFTNASEVDLSNDMMELYTEYMAGAQTDETASCEDGY